MEVAEGFLVEGSGIGAASRARDEFQAVEYLSAIGDRKGAIAAAQGFMWESGSVVLGATGYGAGARAISGEMAAARLAATRDRVLANIADSQAARRSSKFRDYAVREGQVRATLEVRGPYSHLSDPPNVGFGEHFSHAQKMRIYEENIAPNGGVLRSDRDGSELVLPSRSERGVTPPPNEAQIDHIVPRVPLDPSVIPGSNSYRNAQVLSRTQNREKWNR